MVMIPSKYSVIGPRECESHTRYCFYVCGEIFLPEHRNSDLMWEFEGLNDGRKMQFGEFALTEKESLK